MKIFKEPLEFQWDKGNIDKSFEKHKVVDKEAEEPFFDKKHKTFKDKLHSKGEERYRIVGKTKKGRMFYGCSNYPKCTHISQRLPKEE